MVDFIILLGVAVLEIINFCSNLERILCCQDLLHLIYQPHLNNNLNHLNHLNQLRAKRLDTLKQWPLENLYFPKDIKIFGNIQILIGVVDTLGQEKRE